MHAPWRRGGRATESREVGPKRVESSRGAQRVCACALDQTVCTLLARAARRTRALANMSERIGPPPSSSSSSPPPPPPRCIFATSFIGVESENQSSLRAIAPVRPVTDKSATRSSDHAFEAASIVLVKFRIFRIGRLSDAGPRNGVYRCTPLARRKANVSLKVSHSGRVSRKGKVGSNGRGIVWLRP